MAARSTALATDLIPDDPLDQSGEYKFNSTDRQYIDTQILAAQLHLSRLINGTYATWFRVSSGSATLAAGDVVCLASDGTSEPTVTLADPAALAVARVALGVVLAAASPGARVRVASFGVVHQNTTGLAAGAAGFVRVSSAGRAEKVASFGAGDYPLGAVDDAGFLSVVVATAVGASGVASVAVNAPILNNGTPTAPDLALDYTLAATANKVPIRGAAGESSFARIYTGGTVHPSAVLSVARNLTVIGGKTSGGDDHEFLSEDGGDGLVYGTRTRTALHEFRCKTSGYLTVYVDAVEVLRVSSTGANVGTGLAYQVNSVTVASAPAGIPTLGNTSTANTHINVASGGSIRFLVNSVERAGVNDDGFLLPSDKALTIGSDVVCTAPSNIPTFGSNSAAGVDVRVGAGSIRVFVNNAVVFELDPTGIAFFGTSTASVQTVTGSRGGNAALASLLTALATFGLIVDSTSA